MKLFFSVEDSLCGEEVYGGMTAKHKGFVADIPDDLLPSDVVNAYKEMYDKNKQFPHKIHYICTISPDNKV